MTLNICGISNAKKIKILEKFLRTNDIDIAFLQEVVCEEVGSFSSYNAYNNVGSAGRGCCILTRHGLELQDVEKEPGGRIVKGVLNGVTVLNLYAPSGTHNRAARATFFTEDVPYFLRQAKDNFIMAGDFNCILRAIDSTGATPFCGPLQNLIDALNLKDVVERLGITRPHYTYVSTVASSRIDRIYITTGMAVQDYDVIPVTFSDHHGVILRIKGFPRPKTLAGDTGS